MIKQVPNKYTRLHFFTTVVESVFIESKYLLQKCKYCFYKPVVLFFIFPKFTLKIKHQKKLSDKGKHTRIHPLLTFVARMKFKFAKLLIVKYSIQQPRSNTNTKSDKSFKTCKHYTPTSILSSIDPGKRKCKSLHRAHIYNFQNL